MSDRTERQNIERIQLKLMQIEATAREELNRAKDAKNADYIVHWTHIYADAMKTHANWSDRLKEAFPEFSAAVINDGPSVEGGGR